MTGNTQGVTSRLIGRLLFGFLLLGHPSFSLASPPDGAKPATPSDPLVIERVGLMYVGGREVPLQDRRGGSTGQEQRSNCSDDHGSA